MTGNSFPVGAAFDDDVLRLDLLRERPDPGDGAARHGASPLVRPHELLLPIETTAVEGDEPDPPELSIVMPCLNEADTLATCIRKARRALRDARIAGEIVVADNGSTDRSREIALACGARLVDVLEPGYGSALIGGIRAARGRFVLMGDADDSYDFGAIAPFVAKLREGYELVQGCRLPAGGGRIERGAMPLSHRWIGNPLLTSLARWWFQAPVRDVYCGMRAFRRELFDRLEQSCRGMEFATEMIILASRAKARITEVPITLHKDGRVAHPPHLKTMRDGWRTLRLFLAYSPTWLYGHPARALALLGAVGYCAIAAGWVADDRWAAFLLVFASLAGLGGFQAAKFAQLAAAVGSQGLEDDVRREWALERQLVTGAALLVLGLVLALRPLVMPFEGGVGAALRWIVPGMALAALAFQVASFAFFVHLLGLRRG